MPFFFVRWDAKYKASRPAAFLDVDVFYGMVAYLIKHYVYFEQLFISYLKSCIIFSLLINNIFFVSLSNIRIIHAAIREFLYFYKSSSYLSMAP